MKYFLILGLLAAIPASGYPGLAQWQSFGGSPGAVADFQVQQSDWGHMVARSTFPASGSAVSQPEAPRTTGLNCRTPISQAAVGFPETPAIARLFALPFGTEPSVSVLDVDS